MCPVVYVFTVLLGIPSGALHAAYCGHCVHLQSLRLYTQCMWGQTQHPMGILACLLLLLDTVVERFAGVPSSVRQIRGAAGGAGGELL